MGVFQANRDDPGNCSLFWHGRGELGPRFVALTLAAGGEEVMEVAAGHRFSFALVGTLQLLSDNERGQKMISKNRMKQVVPVFHLLQVSGLNDFS